MKNIAFTVVALAATIVALLLPNRFTENSRAMYANSERVRARITEVDNSTVKMIGPVKQGEQQLEMTVLSGKFKGRTFRSTNNLVGKIELDKLYSAGDSVLAVLDLTGPKSDQGSDVLYATVFDHYRTGKTVALALLFFGLLILVTGSVGVKTVISFVFTGAMIVKVLLPAMMDGADPVIASFAVTTALTAAITLLVGGVNRRGFAAFAGAALGVLATAVLAQLCTVAFRLHGATRAFSESLLYSGYAHLDIQNLFIGGIFLASSGAVIDLAMDIAAGMSEVQEQQPQITRRGLIASGLSMSRFMTGTMTTTLLLAYSAEYTAMLMTFIAQSVPLENILNMVFVSAEVVHTLVGCFGLVLVAPFTAVAGGCILHRGNQKTA